jgi:hypothetical protein
MKKICLSAALFLLLLMGLGSSAKAQLNFTNFTPCWVRVMGTYANTPNPCAMGPYCNSPWIAVPPFGMGVLPAGNCPLPPAPNSNYIRVLINFGGGFFGASACPINPVPVVDCQGNPRTLLMNNFNNASVF